MAQNWEDSPADWAMGDFDADGVVGASDLEVIARHWSGPGGVPQAVPAPATLVTLAAGAVALAGRKRHSPGGAARRLRRP